MSDIAMIIKSPPTFDTIPEDVALSIVNVIQGWAKAENQEEIDKGRKARDSTLRAATLTSSRMFETYFTSLLQHVTIDKTQFFSFVQTLESRGPRYGKFVRSLRLEQKPKDDEETRDMIRQAMSFSTLPKSAKELDRLIQGSEVAAGRLYQQMSNLQELVVGFSFLSFHNFHQTIGGRRLPCSFLTGSLKKLQFKLWEGAASIFNLNARNVVWLLSFSAIEEASLGCDMNLEDFKYLSELGHTFFNLSRIKKLAIIVRYQSEESDKRTWWHSTAPASALCYGPNKKSEALIRLFQATKKLECLEVNIVAGPEYEEPSNVEVGFLASLHASWFSLKHLRLLGAIDVTDQSLAPSRLRLFKRLRMVTLERDTAWSAQILPPTLEILYLAFHRFRASHPSEADFEEEINLGNLLELQRSCLPKFKEMVVPSNPRSPELTEAADPTQHGTWVARRKQLGEIDLFKSGTAKLRKVEIGEIVGDVFWSTVSWLSPP